MKPLTTIIIPVLNESENIIPLVARLKKALKDHPADVWFIDDSRDNRTIQAVKTVKLGYDTNTFTVRILHRQGIKLWGGLSGAVVDGIKRARSEQIIIMDGDLQHPPETIPALLAAAKSNDIVMASRYQNGGSASGLSSRMRHIVSRGSTILTKVFFPLRMRAISDPMTGFFLIKRSLINTKKLQPKGFKILLEILITHPRLSVTEVPLRFAKREVGNSHGSLRQGREFIDQLCKLRVISTIQQYQRLPKFVQFSTVGGSVFVAGMVLLYILVSKLHLSPLIANAMQLLVTFELNYLLNKRLTWRERTGASASAGKFLVSRAITTLLNYLLFVWLITVQLSFTLFAQHISLSINYLLANVVSLLAVTIINFVISDQWVFAEKTGRGSNAYVSSGVSFGTIIISIGAGTALFWAVHRSAPLTLAVGLAVGGVALFIQATVEVWRMIYSYRKPDAADRLKFPPTGTDTEHFCLIVPARHESSVLAGTLRQLRRQTHPSVEILSVICDDDIDTLRVAYDAIAGDDHMAVLQYPLRSGVKPSKPKQLNYALSQIKDLGFTVIGIFDAEDNVHPELLRHIDAAFQDKTIGIVQGGVQLMNHDSSWYSLHNVLEYYRWFNSAMAFHADSKFVPLGGNTIFIRYEILREAGGWPVTLTEDCSLGVLLSTRYQINTAVYYEPRLATREETPSSLMGLFHQHVRWSQGFFSEWRKGVWRELPSFKQRLLAGYVLLGPVLLASISAFIALSLVGTFFLNAPVGLVMIMYIPLIPVSVLLILNAIFLYDFGKAFDRKIRRSDYIKLFATYFAYQAVLNTAALWSVIRELRGDTSWYKTTHSGQHRLQTAHAISDNFSASSVHRKIV